MNLYIQKLTFSKETTAQTLETAAFQLLFVEKSIEIVDNFMQEGVWKTPFLPLE